MLLGKEEFIERLKGNVAVRGDGGDSSSTAVCAQTSTHELFEGKRTKAKRDTTIAQAVPRYGYSQRE